MWPALSRICASVTPHVAQNTTNRRSAIDGWSDDPGYAASGRLRKCIEEVFGWTKAAAGFRKTHHRGLARVGGHLDRHCLLPKLAGAVA